MVNKYSPILMFCLPLALIACGDFGQEAAQEQHRAPLGAQATWPAGLKRAVLQAQPVRPGDGYKVRPLEPGKGYAAENRRWDLEARFSSSAVVVTSTGARGRVELRLSGFGRAGSVGPVERAGVSARGRRVELARGRELSEQIDRDLEQAESIRQNATP